jgi:hypothetical protein
MSCRGPVINESRWVSISGSLAALILGGLFFFDIIGVFGLDFAITGLIIFVVCSFAVFRLAAPKGASR